MDRFTEDFLIIIVIYKTSLEACESFQSVKAMKPQRTNLNVFVYDNSPTSQPIKNHEGLKITYLHDPMNSGVSKAYNTGAEHARNKGLSWLLLLDQDTSLPNSILGEYNKAINNNPEVKLFAPVLKLRDGNIFSPSRYRFKRGFFLKNIKPGIHSLLNFAPVNSGMLIETEAFFKVGGYNEKVKLDFADFQFIERFRRSFTDFFVLNVECEQDFSDDSSSAERQKVRFRYYCEGARNVENKTIWDWLQYNAVVFMRAIRLTFRFGKLNFLGTYYKNFLFASKA